MFRTFDFGHQPLQCHGSNFTENVTVPGFTQVASAPQADVPQRVARMTNAAVLADVCPASKLPNWSSKCEPSWDSGINGLAPGTSWPTYRYIPVYTILGARINGIYQFWKPKLMVYTNSGGCPVFDTEMIDLFQ